MGSRNIFDGKFWDQLYCRWLQLLFICSPQLFYLRFEDLVGVVEKISEVDNQVSYQVRYYPIAGKKSDFFIACNISGKYKEEQNDGDADFVEYFKTVV